MGTGNQQPPLKVDPELLRKYGGQLLNAAGDLPDAPPPFTVSGTDAISQAIADKLPSVEGPIQSALPQLKDEASNTASNVVTAAGRYSSTDAQLAADYEKHQFDSAAGTGGGGSGAGPEGMSQTGQMGQMTSMPMQMAGQAAQMPMQAMSAVAQVPQGTLQGVQQIGQTAGGMGSSAGPSDKPDEQGTVQPSDPRDEDQDKQRSEPRAAAGDANAERAPEPQQSSPQQSSPRHAAPNPEINL
jgi:ESX secretion-associated protein EspJ